MKLQLAIFIAVCFALLLIGGIYFFIKDSPERGHPLNLESEEFKQLRTDATGAFNAGKYQQAIDLYNEALKMRPKNSEIYNDLGAVYYKQGLDYAGPRWPSWKKDLWEESPVEAVEAFKTAVAETVSGIIEFEVREEVVAAAIEEAAKEIGGEVFRRRWEKVIRLNILIGQTKVYLLKARDHYLQSLELKSTHSLAHRNLGAFYVKVGRADKALGYLENAYHLDPRDTELEEYLNQLRE